MRRDIRLLIEQPRNQWPVPLESTQVQREKEINQPGVLGCVTHFHGFDSFICLLDGVDLNPFLGMRK